MMMNMYRLRFVDFEWVVPKTTVISTHSKWAVKTVPSNTGLNEFDQDPILYESTQLSSEKRDILENCEENIKLLLILLQKREEKWT